MMANFMEKYKEFLKYDEEVCETLEQIKNL